MGAGIPRENEGASPTQDDMSGAQTPEISDPAHDPDHPDIELPLMAEAEEEASSEAMIERLEGELARAKDQLLRLAAELENTRRRAEREREDAARYAIANFARDLLSVTDIFDRAIASAPSNPAATTPEAVQTLIDGVRMTEKELIKVFERNGVHRLMPKGARFDPNLHQAIAQMPGNGVEKDIVMDVAQPGFTIGDRVLRAAMVVVSNGAGGTPGSGDVKPEDPAPHSDAISHKDQISGGQNTARDPGE